MGRITFGVILGLATGIIDVVLMLPLAFPDRLAALLGAFSSRFALGFFASASSFQCHPSHPGSWLVSSRASRTRSSRRPTRQSSLPAWCPAQSRDGS